MQQEELLRSWRIDPAEDAREVTVHARDGALSADQVFTVGPPAAKVELSLAANAPVKGRDTETTIEVRVVRSDGTVDPNTPPPVLTANVGTISAPEPLEPGHFRAHYLLPKTRYPEVAVIVAFAPWPHSGAIHGAVGSLLVPLASAIDLPGHTERNAQMSIEISGQTYGPTKAGADGRFTLPVVVPPGHRFGKGIAVDRAGNRRVTKIDLLLPPTDQLACVMNPRRLPANGVARARVVCAATDPYGAPQKRANVELKVSAGQRSARRTIGDGLFEWIYTAPAQLSAKPVELTAQWRDGRNVSREALEAQLVQGAAERLELTASEPVVFFGGELHAQAVVTDALGRPRDGATVVFGAPFGSFDASAPKSSGTYASTWTLPPDGDADRAKVTARAFGPRGSEPAELSSWLEDGEVWVGVRDLAGWPVPDQTLRVGEQTVKTGPDGAVRVGRLAPGAYDVRHARWSGLELRLFVIDGTTIWPNGDRPGAPLRSVEVMLGPPVPVIVRIAVSGHELTYWAEDPKGRLLPDRSLAVDVQGAKIASKRARDGRTSITLTGAPAQISIADLQTGVTGLAEVTR